MPDETKPRYQQPPKEHQFKPGKSGNPRGRPKGTRNLLTDLTDLLSGKIIISVNGQRRRMSRQEALLLSLHHKAALGDIKAATSLLNMVVKLNPDPVRPASEQPLSESDEEIVADLFRRYGLKPEGDQPC